MSKNTLPDEWSDTHLGNVVDYGTTNKVSKDDVNDDTWLLELEDIEKDSSVLIKRVTCKQREFKSTKNQFTKGDVLYGKLRPYLNKIIHADMDGVCSTEIIPIKENSVTHSRFLFFWIKSSRFSDYVTKAGYGVNMPRLGTKDGRLAPLVLPPLAEQKEIADRLDELLGSVARIKARIDTIPNVLKRFRQSVLSAAVSGKLTEGWREKNQTENHGKEVIARDLKQKRELVANNPKLAKKKSSIECQIEEDYTFELPNSWAFTTWGQTSEWITYGFTRPMPKSDKGIKQVTAKDVKNFSLNLKSANSTTNEAFEKLSDKDSPQRGDLLLTKDGSIGRAALVQTDEIFCINQSVAVCWLRTTEINKTYLEYLANANFTQKFIKDKAQGMAIQHLSIIDFAKCPLPVPPTTEQTEIVRSVEELFCFADKLESHVMAAQSRINHLSQSILAKAFRGELTADWRSAHPELITGEHSAEALLARIQAERQKLTSTKKKTTRKRAAK